MRATMMMMSVVLCTLFGLTGGALARSDEVQIKKLVKEAERSAFERHGLDIWRRAFTPDVSFSRGRRAVRDAHDLKFDLKTELAIRRMRQPVAISGQDRMFFEDESLEVDGDTAIYEMDVIRRFFGGVDKHRYRLKLVRKSSGWLISEWRAWPLREHLGAIEEVFTDGFWLDADEKCEDKTADPKTRMGYLIAARHYAEGLELTGQQVAGAGSKDAQWWIRHAEMLAVNGNLKAVAAAVKTARKLDSFVDVPPFLVPKTKTKRRKGKRRR